MDINKAKYLEGIGWRCDTDTTRHHREKTWDYKGRAIYHITLATQDRQPIFGTLIGNNVEEAFIVHSRLGEYVNMTFRGLPDFYQRKGIKIRILAVRIMPDHLHGVIHVLDPMPKSIGEIIRSFKSACTSWFKREYIEHIGNNAEVMHTQTKRIHPASTPTHIIDKEQIKSILQNESILQKATLTQQQEQQLMHFCRIFATRNSIWEYMPAGYHERILHCEGQLNHMINYVKDNPRRRWLKLHNPDLFRLRNDLCWSFVDETGVPHKWKFRALGNIFLLNFPNKQHIQCSRSITTDELYTRCQVWMDNAQNGIVSITSAISEGERNVSKRLREAGMPLIVMLKDGFPPVGSPYEHYYKPGGVYFEACAAGKLLLIEPYHEILDDPLIIESVYRKSPMASRTSMRYHFLALNKIGETLSNTNLSQP